MLAAPATTSALVAHFLVAGIGYVPLFGLPAIQTPTQFVALISNKYRNLKPVSVGQSLQFSQFFHRKSAVVKEIYQMVRQFTPSCY